ncbi:MAG: phage terminase large subunit [Bacteroidales bacterium]|nr:phage terminase large subunit [Bacteroidales bacterium]
MTRQDLVKAIRLKKELLKCEARKHLLRFTLATMPTFRPADFHRQYYEVLTRFSEGEIKKLMVFMPPQHGKSEGSTRRLPSFILGKNPDKKVAIVSYSATKARKFNKEIQRIIDTEEYREIFPGTSLDGTGSDSGEWLRNSDECEIVGHRGGFKTVGVGGTLTGEPVDVLIMDDIYKDAKTAWSRVVRENIADWYDTVAETRLHNESQQLIVFTRWHEDDLAGRLIEQQGVYDPDSNPDGWVIVTFRAIKEGEPTKYDKRHDGEALWPERHSLHKLESIRNRTPRTFEALYQQRPTIQGGNIIKRDWFQHVSQFDFKKMHGSEPIVFFMDTAYTANAENDPTGIIATCKIGGEVYVTHAEKVLMKFPDLIRHITPYVRTHGYTNRSTIRIEPKANGISVVDQLKDQTGLNVVKTPSPKDDKETRLNVASPSVEAGRVVLVDGPWTEAFIDEVCGFPTKLHDEYVDVLCYAVDYHLDNPYKPIDRARLAKQVY